MAELRDKLFLSLLWVHESSEEEIYSFKHLFLHDHIDPTVNTEGHG